MILVHLRKYPLSILIILTIIYLSFFRPPSIGLGRIPHMDKIVHILMYFGLSGMLWLEFLRGHQKGKIPFHHAWLGAFVCPIVFSGIIEILQEQITTYRGGDWFDLLANTVGVVLASLIAFFLLRPFFNKNINK